MTLRVGDPSLHLMLRSTTCGLYSNFWARGWVCLVFYVCGVSPEFVISAELVMSPDLLACNTTVAETLRAF